MGRSAVFLILLCLFTVVGRSMELSGSEVRSYGITEHIEKLVITENIVLSGRAVLTFHNTTINMAPTTDWQYRITVKDNARLILDTATLNVSTQKSLRINVTDSGVLELRNSSIKVTELIINSKEGFYAVGSDISAITSINASTVVVSGSAINSKLILGLKSDAIEIRDSILFNGPTPQPSNIIIEGGAVQVTDSVIENHFSQFTYVIISGEYITLEKSKVNNTAIVNAKVSLSSQGQIGAESSEFYVLSETNESELSISGSEVTFQETGIWGGGKYSNLLINSTSLEIADSIILFNGTKKARLSADSTGNTRIGLSRVTLESENTTLFELAGDGMDIRESRLNASAERRLGTLSQMRLSFNVINASDSELSVQDGAGSGVKFDGNGRLENTTLNSRGSLFQNSIFVYAGHSIDVYWYALIEVKDLRGYPITGVTVQIADPMTSVLISERTTDSNGLAKILLKAEEVTPQKESFLGNFKVKIIYESEVQTKTITLENTQKVEFSLPVQTRTEIPTEIIPVSESEEEADQTYYWIALVLGFAAVGFSLLEGYVKTKHRLETRKSSREYLEKMREKEREAVTGPKLEL